jgi:hypothetical protein
MSGSKDETLRELTDSDWFRTGWKSAAVFSCNSEWLFRRVEAIEFLDLRSVRRSVTIDFEVPKGLPALGDRGRKGTVLVPIAVMEKWPPPMDFHLVDWAGHSLSRYLSTTTKRLDFGLLLGMVDLALAHESRQDRKASEWCGSNGPKGLAPVLQRELAALIREAQPSQADVANAVNGLAAELRKRLDGALFRERSKDCSEIATQVAATIDLAGRLASGSILWVVVPGEPGTDRIVKFSYVGPYLRSSPEFAKDTGPEHRTRGIRDHLRESRRYIELVFSWRPRTLIIPLVHAGREVRYHLDVRAPDGAVEMLEAKALALPSATSGRKQDVRVSSVTSLAIKYPELDPPDEWVGTENSGYYLDYGKPIPMAITSPAAGARHITQAERDADASAEIVDRQAHLYLGTKGAPSHRVLLQLKLVAARQGFIQACMLAAGAITLLMWFAYLRLDSAALHVEATVVLLSVVPVVLGYVVVNPDEKPFEHVHFSGVRLLALISGSTPIVGALLLVLTNKGKKDPVPPELSFVQPVWLGLAILSTLAAVGLFLSWHRAAKPSRDI